MKHGELVDLVARARDRALEWARDPGILHLEDLLCEVEIECAGEELFGDPAHDPAILPAGRALLGRTKGGDRLCELAQVQVGVGGAAVGFGIVIVDRRGAREVRERRFELPVAACLVTGGDRLSRRRERDAVARERELHAARRSEDLRDLERLAIDDRDRAAQRLAGADDRGLPSPAVRLARAAEPIERGGHLFEAVGGGIRGGAIALEAQHLVTAAQADHQAFIVAARLCARDRACDGLGSGARIAAIPLARREVAVGPGQEVLDATTGHAGDELERAVDRRARLVVLACVELLRRFVDRLAPLVDQHRRFEPLPQLGRAALVAKVPGQRDNAIAVPLALARLVELARQGLPIPEVPDDHRRVALAQLGELAVIVGRDRVEQLAAQLVRRERLRPLATQPIEDAHARERRTTRVCRPARAHDADDATGSPGASHRQRAASEG